jgi:C4-dicarboxylate-specific signal transduction histidine kinase
VRSELAPTLPGIRGDRVQLQQVLLNLCVNACDSMSSLPPEKRKVFIGTALGDDGSVLVSIVDRGTGICATSQGRLFEPFFTTKEHGLGLGLVICRSITLAHGGRLWATNNPDCGATFHLALPAQEEVRT